MVEVVAKALALCSGTQEGCYIGQSTFVKSETSHAHTTNLINMSNDWTTQDTSQSTPQRQRRQSDATDAGISVIVHWHPPRQTAASYTSKPCLVACPVPLEPLEWCPGCLLCHSLRCTPPRDVMAALGNRQAQAEDKMLRALASGCEFPSCALACPDMSQESPHQCPPPHRCWSRCVQGARVSDSE